MLQFAHLNRHKFDYLGSCSIVFSALCPVGYTAPHGSSCYKFVTDTTDWFEAFYSCQRAEARLVAIETAEEDAHLRGYIKKHFKFNTRKFIIYNDKLKNKRSSP